MEINAVLGWGIALASVTVGSPLTGIGRRCIPVLVGLYAFVAYKCVPA